MSEQLGITVKKSENFSEWYNQVVLKSELADYAAIKGFMVIRPLGYAVWENIMKAFDGMIKKLGHKNTYFPSLIPEKFLHKEAEHFKGFVPEAFIVTHSGNNKLEERLVVRPTSETIMYDSYARWIRSWRDLPLLLNQWNNVLRAEIKATKLFLRTSEFLWQEGHTVHATKEEADKEVITILELYKKIAEEYLAIPVIAGRKSEMEKFAGALYTTAIEALMPDGRALQAGTSHNLGQNFAKAFDIKFLDKDGQNKYAWQTSWGISTRLIGGMIMTHSDDKGLVLPPKIAPTHAVVIPIKFNEEEKVLKEAMSIKTKLEDANLNVELDDRNEYTPGWKFNEWELKGVPVRIEIGPKDLKKKEVVLVRRDTSQKTSVKISKLVKEVESLLNDIQKNLYKKVKKFLEDETRIAKNYQEFKEVIVAGGFVKAGFCGSRQCEEKIKNDTTATSRVIPFKKEPVKCIICNKDGEMTYFAKAY
ncbi:MAG: proline--tRNA ligase [Candidatus Aenigmarchaeota archaeon]|nr:proline--tRNA ligase [Candidatus Aenigmarchaeota archaeon]